MSGKKAGFVTGANAKIMIDDTTIAYATNVGYDITVQTIPIEGIGRYEVWSNEPVSYSCSGSFTVIRYTARANTSKISGAQDTGNAAATIAVGPGDTAGTLNEHLNPRDLLKSQTFDMKIFEKSAGADGANDNVSLVTSVIDCRVTRRSGNLDKRGVLMDNYTFVGILAGDANETGASNVAESATEDGSQK